MSGTAVGKLSWALLLLLEIAYSQPCLASAPQMALFPAQPALAAPLEVTLKLPLKAIRNSDITNPEEFEAELVLADGTLIPLKVSARGKSRRKRCKFPPLRLNFSKAGTQGTPFAGQDKLKLVSHCASGMAKGPYLASEMLAYRLLNLLTERSFRVRALKITYQDSVGTKVESRHAFLIEHKHQVAKRLGYAPKRSQGIRIRDLDADHSALVSLFQYMIGNADYSLRQPAKNDGCCHNVVPYDPNPDSDLGVVAIPYDFDASGLVNAPYAEPQPSLNIKSVTQRVYRGYCAHEGALAAALVELREKKPQILALASSFDDVPRLNRKRAAKYLGAFFSTVEDSRQLERKVIKRCR